MRNPKVISAKEASEMFINMMRQWQYNAAELGKKSKSNPKVREMCQQLSESMACVEEWSQLDGSIMLVAAYQPGMFDDAEFDEGLG